ncbi:MAG: hypothetical protein KTR31_24045 [Myxococcales bacterium]|nr:hypothetical protein [Myxococcales bacterium]
MVRRWMACVLAGALGSCGLTEPAQPDPAPEPAPVEPAEAEDDEMAVKQAMQMAPAKRKDAIDWAAAFERQRIDVSGFSTKNRATLERSNVPVLLPSDPDLCTNLTVLAGEGWYTATLGPTERQIFVRGTRLATPRTWTEEEKRALGADDAVRISRLDGLVSASFSLFGAAYSLELECTKGMDDPFCADDEAVKRLVTSLGFAGGGE